MRRGVKKKNGEPLPYVASVCFGPSLRYREVICVVPISAVVAQGHSRESVTSRFSFVGARPQLLGENQQKDHQVRSYSCEWIKPSSEERGYTLPPPNPS